MIDILDKNKIDSFLIQLRLEKTKEKLFCQKLQRIFMKYNKEYVKSCLCTSVIRRLWLNSFETWYNESK